MAGCHSCLLMVNFITYFSIGRRKLAGWQIRAIWVEMIQTYRGQALDLHGGQIHVCRVVA